MNSINSVEKTHFTPRTIVGALAALLLSSLLVACGGQSGEASSDGGAGSSKLTLVAYSTPPRAYGEVLPAFAQSPEGQGVTFNQSYGSGEGPGATRPA